MKRILVISDNPFLTSFFINECKVQEVTLEANIKYHYTKVNLNPSEMIRLGATAIDVKDPSFLKGVEDSCDLIISIHCKQIFPSKLVDLIPCINIHPGLNPHNRGWYPQVFSIINKKPIGATVHLMDKEVDHGPIIDQIEITADAVDTSSELYEKIVEAEKLLISKNLKNFMSGEFDSKLPFFNGNYNSISDFRSLCFLDLDAEGTLRSHIDLLRALTHKNFKNAYYIDEQGRKVFIRISLEREV